MNTYLRNVRQKIASKQPKVYIALIAFFGGVILATQTPAAPTQRVWTLEAIEKTGALAKCEEIRQLYLNDRPTKAEAVWKEFKKRNSALFVNNSIFGSAPPKTILRLTGRWSAQVFRTDYGSIEACVCSETLESCPREAHLPPYHSLADIHEGHFHLSYDDNMLPHRLRDSFEQAAQRKVFLKDVHVAPESLLSDFFVKNEGENETCDLKVSVFGVGRGWVKLIDFKVSNEKIPRLEDSPESSENK
ncbi:hypothetical protein [Turneriella parva]|uniref:Uncharacterized protein n=1 Tax=Turneriella parva (strain ATCC BAA-1111 / DSM 21527 / NCTC 11395 / H) TaxID=869212 RepID=I4B9M4_TURPD|nr:hypothetical protein [Turneriella parva]AFM13981.1 hypothetical protein Turpa_3343 [Turneriella parva DSM 21527]